MGARTQAAGTNMTNRDATITEIQESGRRAVMPLSQIKAREVDTRQLNVDHVLVLALSIEALGLIEPIVLDQRNVLLAGGHRLAACRLLLSDDPAAYLTSIGLVSPANLDQLALISSAGELTEEIPVRVLDIDAGAQPDLALAVEAAENNTRRDYTRREIFALYHRLLDAGFTAKPGRPRRGERAAKPALAAIIGRKLRTIERMLSTKSSESEDADQRALRRLETAIKGLEGRSAFDPLLKALTTSRIKGLIEELHQNPDT